MHSELDDECFVTKVEEYADGGLIWQSHQQADYEYDTWYFSNSTCFAALPEIVWQQMLGDYARYWQLSFWLCSVLWTSLCCTATEATLFGQMFPQVSQFQSNTDFELSTRQGSRGERHGAQRLGLWKRLQRATSHFPTRVLAPRKSLFKCIG